MQMQLEYAKKLLNGSYVFGHRMVSCHDGHLVVDDSECYSEDVYLGTQLIDGEYQVNDRGMVTFNRVTPVVDESTHFA